MVCVIDPIIDCLPLFRTPSLPVTKEWIMSRKSDWCALAWRSELRSVHALFMLMRPTRFLTIRTHTHKHADPDTHTHTHDGRYRHSYGIDTHTKLVQLHILVHLTSACLYCIFCTQGRMGSRRRLPISQNFQGEQNNETRVTNVSLSVTLRCYISSSFRSLLRLKNQVKVE